MEIIAANHIMLSVVYPKITAAKIRITVLDFEEAVSSCLSFTNIYQLWYILVNDKQLRFLLPCWGSLFYHNCKTSLEVNCEL